MRATPPADPRGWEPTDFPAQLRHNALRLPGGGTWLRNLRQQVAERCTSWNLRLDPEAGGPWFAGHAGIVVPVVDAEGKPYALKCQIPDPDLACEAGALAFWGGHGAVRLIRSDDGLLLLERLLPHQHLGELPVADACDVWGSIMRRISPRTNALSACSHETTTPATSWERTDAVAERWNDELPARWADSDGLLPRRLLESALETCQLRGSVGRRDSNDYVLHGDLHYFNVLARPNDGEYVAIDPQAFIGDREYAVLPMLHNRLAELPGPDQGAALRSRLRYLCSAAGLDPSLATGWSIARAVEDVLTFAEEDLPLDALRSLWVATALSGGDMSALPDARELKPLV